MCLCDVFLVSASTDGINGVTHLLLVENWKKRQAAPPATVVVGDNTQMSSCF